MATALTTTTNVSPSTVPCYKCERPIAKRTAQPIRLLTPTDRYHDGIQVLRASNETVYVCDECLAVESDEIES